MAIDYDINYITIIHAFGVFQGLVMGLVFVLINTKRRASLFLGLFLLGFAIEFTPILLQDLKIVEHNPELLLLPINASWILFPLFFIYVQKVSVLTDEGTSHYWLYPGLASILFQFLLLLLPTEIVDFLKKNYVFETFFILGLAYSIFIVYKIISFIKKHVEEVQNLFATTKNNQLQWTRFFVLFCLVLVATRILSLFIDHTSHLHLFLSTLSLIFVFSISWIGLLQYKIIGIGENFKKFTATDESLAIDEKQVEKIMIEIDGYVRESEIYKKSDLSLDELAIALNRHPKLLLHAIKITQKKNFNSYIDQFRIEYAKKLIHDRQNENLGMDMLAKEVGFHSKGSFSKAFKKIVGTPPLKFM